MNSRSVVNGSSMMDDRCLVMNRSLVMNGRSVVNGNGMVDDRGLVVDWSFVMDGSGMVDRGLVMNRSFVMNWSGDMNGRGLVVGSSRVRFVVLNHWILMICLSNMRMRVLFVLTMMINNSLRVLTDMWVFRMVLCSRFVHFFVRQSLGRFVLDDRDRHVTVSGLVSSCEVCILVMCDHWLVMSVNFGMMHSRLNMSRAMMHQRSFVRDGVMSSRCFVRGMMFDNLSVVHRNFMVSLVM